jgi:RimJ/RimL family protein N-acetyltransferase
MLDPPGDPEAAYTRSIQAEMHTAGIVPFSGSMLAGQLGPVATLVVGTPSAEVMAVAHAYLPHNRFSPYEGYAWGGLVTVVERYRGKGLGNYVNALMVVAAFDRLGATHVYELVSATNEPSRRMVESCGLRHEPGFVCGVASKIDRTRFTR